MQEQKSMGGALVDVFDAGVALVKTEIRGVAHQAGEIAKAKGTGIVLLLAAVVPLSMFLIFFILSLYWMMIRFLGWHPWAASLAIALVGLVLTGVLVMMGMSKLSAELPQDNTPLTPLGRPQELGRVQYPTGTTGTASVTANPSSVVVSTPTDAQTRIHMQEPVTTQAATEVVTRTGRHGSDTEDAPTVPVKDLRVEPSGAVDVDPRPNLDKKEGQA